MNWNSFADFVAMGGYGLYVWGAFGVAASAMALEVLSLRARRRALQTGDAVAEAPTPVRVEVRVDYREGLA